MSKKKCQKVFKSTNDIIKKNARNVVSRFFKEIILKRISCATTL